MTETSDTIGEVAVAWVVRMASDQRTRADEEAFRAWMEEDPAHAEAYAECAALWDDVGAMASSDEGRTTLKHLRPARRVPGQMTRRAAIFGGSGIAAAAAGFAAFLEFRGEQTLQTAPGEQKRFQLADGSDVLLNTDSRLRIKMARGERRIFLDRGQAFFKVAKDKSRPFRVFVGHDEVRALGTAFEVRRLGDDVQVTLEEGRVAIYRTGGAPPQTLSATPNSGAVGPHPTSAGATEPVAVLAPGQQAVVAPAQIVAVREVDLRRTQAWRYGRMILDDSPIGDAVADLNRYGGVQIILSDPKLADIRVSGVFHTGKPDDFVRSITEAFPIEVARQDENTIVLKSR